MPKTQNRAVMIWLFIFAFLVAFLVVWGGYTRLTRSGLSIVEWNPISGTLPPLGEQAWQEEFLKYQQTPEYLHVNTSMTLEEYQFIFFIEWFHRLLARGAQRTGGAGGDAATQFAPVHPGNRLSTFIHHGARRCLWARPDSVAGSG